MQPRRIWFWARFARSREKVAAVRCAFPERKSRDFRNLLLGTLSSTCRRAPAPCPIAAAAAVADVFRLELGALRQLVDDHRMIVGEEAIGRPRGRVLGPPRGRLD